MKTLIAISPDETQRERRDRERLAFRFFHEWAGWSWKPEEETEAQGRTRCAWAMAEAEAWGRAQGVRFEWERDERDSSEWSDERPAWAQYVCIARLGGSVVASLCGIDFGKGCRPGGTYKRVVEAEMAMEAMNEANLTREGSGRRLSRKTTKGEAMTAVVIHLREETRREIKKVFRIAPGTVAANALVRGIAHGEPLLVCMDALLRYAQAHRKQWDRPLAEDGVLGDYWLDAAKGIRGLLNGDGAVAHELGVTTDSKDNGCLEALFWHALKAAGYTEADL